MFTSDQKPDEKSPAPPPYANTVAVTPPTPQDPISTAPTPGQQLHISAQIDATAPIVYTTDHGSLVYDPPTAAYWAMWNNLWLRFYTVPKVTISKDEARAFMKEHPSIVTAVEALPKRWPQLAHPAQHRIISANLFFFNCLHDSLLVKRDKKDSGIAPFYLDKIKTPWARNIPNVLGFQRPEYPQNCPCNQLQTYGAIIYCPNCTVIRAQITKPDGSTTLVNLSKVGRMTFYKPIADSMVSAFCAGKGGKFVLENTMALVCAIFHLSHLDRLPAAGLPREVLLSWVMRDSLFVRKYDDKVVSWAEYFKVKEEGAFGAGEAMLLLRIGLAIGTLGALS